MASLSACGLSRSAESAESAESNTDADVVDEDNDNVGDDEELVPEIDQTPPTTAPADDSAISIKLTDGGEISFSHGDLAAIAFASRENEEFASALLTGVPLSGFDVSVLNTMIADAAIGLLVEDEGIKVTDDHQKVAAETGLAELSMLLPPGSESVDMETLTDQTPFLQLLLSIRAKQDALIEHYSNSDDVEEVPCIKHILVETEDEATSIIDQLDEGGDFAALAAEFSTDPGSGSNGGDLGCANLDLYVPEFAEAAGGADLGEIVGPVKSEFGFHIISVYEIGASQDDAVRLLDEALSAKFSDAEVEADPRLGSWDSGSLILVAS